MTNINDMTRNLIIAKGRWLQVHVKNYEDPVLINVAHIVTISPYLNGDGILSPHIETTGDRHWYPEGTYRGFIEGIKSLMHHSTPEHEATCQ